MIRMHKPAGAIWTYASQYQQGERFRHVNVDECTPPPAKVQCPDSDNELSGKMRATKRRRIEKLFNSFLDGKQLFIPSACASGAELRALVRTASRNTSVTSDEVSSIQEDEVWAEEQDGWEVLQAHAKRMAESTKPSGRRRSRRGLSEPIADHIGTTTETHTPAVKNEPPILPRSRPRRLKLSTKPSEEALAKAAELRARNRRLFAEMSDNITVSARKIEPVTHSAPPTARANPSFQQTEAARRIYPQTPADETLADELRLSRTESPSRRPRTLIIQPLASTSFDSNATVENTPGRAYSLDHALPQRTHDRSPGSPDRSPTHLDANQQARSATEDPSITNDTPTNTGSTAMDLCAVRWSGWTAINGTAPAASVATPTVASTAQSKSCTPASAVQRTSTASGAGDNLEPRSTNSGAKSTSGKRRRKVGQTSSQNAVDPGLPHEQQQLMGAFRVTKTDYIIAPASQSGTTPFQYRRKAKAQMLDAQTEITREAEKAAETALEDTAGPPQTSSKSANADMACVSPKALQTPTTAAPASAASDYSLCVGSGLMAKHLNQTLPKDNTSRSSSLRRALRAEMRLSGAQMERAPGEPPSSQVTNGPSESFTGVPPGSTTGIAKDRTEKRKSVLLWPGTQVLLDQAQQDLFISPEKSGNDLSKSVERDSPGPKFNGTPRNASQSSEPEWPPLRPLSQEYAMPSTQALMGEWSPWSTVKKPNVGKRASFAPSPLAGNDTITPTGASSRPLRPALTRSRGPAPAARTNRRSSLRFSTSTAETPMPLPNSISLSASFLDNISLLEDTDDLDKAVHSSSTLKAKPAEPVADTDLDFTTLSFAATSAQLAEEEERREASDQDDYTGAPTSTFDAAQRERDDPEQTLADLATEFLSTADMRTVMSQ